MFARAVYPNHQETRLILEYFGDRRGVFVDVGGNFPETSVSTPLEESGWTGVVIEPQPDCVAELKKKRVSPIVQCACLSQRSIDQGQTTVRLWLAGPKSSVDFDFISPKERTQNFIDVPVLTLNQILNKHNINRIDLLSVDTEGSEISVMEGLDWPAYQPELVLLEDHARNFEKHIFMTRLGYKLFRRTGFNSWYAKSENAIPVSIFGRLQLFRKYVLSMPFRNLRKWRHERFSG